jgi:uncharacterized protein (TIGR03663 family)
MSEVEDKQDHAQQDLLSRPIAAFVKLDWEKTIYILFILLAITTRFWGIGDRVVSHDESLHTQYSYQYFNGDGYTHTPLMHGPSLFHITALSYWLFGVSDASARIMVAIVGVFLVILPYFLRSWIGRIGALMASFILLISPYITYYSRYIRHDIYVIAAAVLTFIAIQYYLRDRKEKYIWWFAVGLALMFTTMETSFIYVAIFGSFLVLRLAVKILTADWFKGRLNALRSSLLVTLIGVLMILGSLLGERLAPRVLEQVSPEITVSVDQGFAADPDKDIDVEIEEEGDSALDKTLRWIQVAGYGVLALGLFLLAVKLRPQIDAFPEFDIVMLFTTLTLPTLTAYLVVTAGGDPLNYALSKCQLAGQETMSAVELFFSRLGQPACRDAFIRSDIIMTAAFLILTLVVSIIVGIWWNRRRWLIAAAIYHTLFLLLFSSLFTNPAGWTSGMVGSLGYWIAQQQVERANQPWFFYAIVLPLYEFLPLILSLLAIHLWSKKNKLANIVRDWLILILVAILANSFVNWFANRNLVDQATATNSAGLVAAVIVLIAGGLILLLFRGKEARSELEAAGGFWGLIDVDSLFGFVPFVIWWFFISWLVYSLAGEKMAWLSTHFIFPMALLAGWYVNERLTTANFLEIRSSRFAIFVGLLLVFLIAAGVAFSPVLLGKVDFGDQTTANLRSFGRLLGSLLVTGVLIYFIWRSGRDLTSRTRKRAWLVAIIGLLSLLTIRFSYMASFVNADYTTEFLVYAHGAPATKTEVISQLEDLSRRLNGDKSIKVAFDNDSSWPYTWYLRDYPNRIYFGENPGRNITEAPVVIVGSQNWGKVEPLLGDDYDSRTYTFLWWPMEEYRKISWNGIIGDPQVEAEFRRGLGNPDVRQALWDIFMYRDYEKYGQVFGGTYTAGEWPLRHDLRMYIRKESLATIWDHGIDAVAAEPPVDLYAENNLSLSPIDVIGTTGAGEGQLMQPRNVAVSPDGDIFVADSGNHRIVVFSPEGKFIRTWGTFGSEPGTFNEPWGLAVDDEVIYVADTWNHRIQKFDHQGSLLSVIGQSGSPSAGQDGGGLFFGPRDIVILNDGNLLVTDTGNHRLQIFDPEGNFLDTAGEQGVQPGQFYEPVGLGYSPSETIYVVDTWNGRIQELTTDLFPLNSWQVDAWFGESINNKPYIAVDDQDRLYVSDPEGYRILVFGPNGQYLGRFGQYALDSSGFGLPNGLAVDREGYLYIADGGNNQILKYAPFPDGLIPTGLDLDQSQDSSGEIESP